MMGKLKSVLLISLVSLCSLTGYVVFAATANYLTVVLEIDLAEGVVTMPEGRQTDERMTDQSAETTNSMRGISDRLLEIGDQVTEEQEANGEGELDVFKEGGNASSLSALD